MNCLKSIFFIPIVESNLIIIFCKNNEPIFNHKLVCFNKKHIIYFIMSLLCILILFYLTYIFITFSFNKIKNHYASIAKYLIMNSSKSFFLNKIIFLIIQGIDSIYSILGLKCFCIFFFSFVHLYCFIIEYSYQDIESINAKLYLYFNFSLSIASTLLLIGFLMKNKSLEGLIYIFFLLIIILFGIIFIWPKQYLKHSISLRFSDDYLAYNQIRLFMNNIKERKINRENLLDFLMICSLSYKNAESAIEEEKLIRYSDEDLDYKISNFIESTLKFKINQFNQSILLKCIYAIYLYEEVFKYNKALLTIISLYEDISQGKISSYLSQEFFIYRLKKCFEGNMSSKNEEYINSELSIHYQINNFLYLILKSSEIYFEFWNLLFNCKQHKDTKLLEKLGNTINLQVKEIHEQFKLLFSKKLKYTKIILLYIYFLRDVLNEYEMSNQILKEAEIQENQDEQINEIIGGNSKVYDLNEIESSSNLQFIISSGIKEHSVGIIQKISHDFSKKLGYSSEQLIGKSINIFLPDFLKKSHEKVLQNKFKNYKFKDEFKSPKKLKGLFYMKSHSMYLIPVYMETYLIFDEDYTPYSFTRLENDKEVVFHQYLSKTCHVATDNNFMIQNFTTNAITMLNLINKDLNGTVDITNYIIELKEHIKNFYYNKETENLNEQVIKDLLLRKKYFLQNDNNNLSNNVITWKRNKKSFNLVCEEIRMNKKLLGYYFHFEYYHPSNNNNSSLCENFELHLSEKQFIKNVTQKIDSSISISNSFGTEFQNGEFKINSNIIPVNEQILNFDIEKYSYVFKDKKFYEYNNENNLLSIQNYVKRFLYEKYNEYNGSMIRSKDISEENNSSNISNSSDSYSSKSESSSEVKKKSVNSSSYNLNDYYKVNLDKITLFYFDFSKNYIQEIKDYPKKDRMDYLMKEELKCKVKCSQRRDSGLIRIKKIKIKNPNPIKVKEKDTKFKNEEIIVNETKTRINKSIYFLLFSVCITFFFSISITFWIVIYSMREKKQILDLVDAINYLNDLNENIAETFYYSVKLTLVQNPKYNNIRPSNDEIKIISRKTLINNFNKMINLIDSLYFNSISFSQKNKEKRNNYKLNLTTITNKDIEVKIEVPVLNALEEFTSLIYFYANKDDSKINLLDKTFNNILKNSEIFLYGYFNEYIQIYENEYLIKIKKNKVYTFCLCFILLIFEIFGLYLILKASFKVSSEKKKFIDFFFQIDKKIIILSMNHCKRFMEVINNMNFSSKHLVSTPKINLEVLSEREEPDENLFIYKQTNKNKGNQLQVLCEDEENDEDSDEMDFENNKNNILNSDLSFFKYEKKAFSYISLYIIFFAFFSALSITFIFIINKKFHQIKDYHELFFYTQKLNLFIIRNVIFLRIFIAYKSTYTEYFFVNNFSNTLYKQFETIYNDNSKYVSDLYDRVNKNFMKKSTKILYLNFQKQSLCYYLDNYINNYGGDCNLIGNGAANFGLNSLSSYLIHSVMHLFHQAILNSNIAMEKGFLFSELFYGTNFYEDFTPSNKSIIEEYKSLDPFELFNSIVMNDLIILNDNIFKKCMSDASQSVVKDINNISDSIEMLLIYLIIFYVLLLILFILFYVIPNISQKNKNINKKRKMLLIIPKSILLDIIIKNS